MKSTFDSSLTLIARLAIALLFVPAGLAKLGDFAGTTGYISSVGLPLPAAGAAAAIVLEIVAGAALALGFFTRFAALALAVFTGLASVIFHAYWVVPADQAYIQQLLFYKNIAVVGGLLILAAYGAGGFSLDARRQSKASVR